MPRYNKCSFVWMQRCSLEHCLEKKYTAGQLSCLRTAARRAYDHSRACGFWNQCCWTWSAVRQDMNCKSHPRVIWRTVTFAFAVLAYSSRKPIWDKSKTKKIIIYIYAFSRHFYPKQQCIQAIHFLSVGVFPGNRTHNLCAANAML